MTCGCTCAIGAQLFAINSSNAIKAERPFAQLARVDIAHGGDGCMYVRVRTSMCRRSTRYYVVVISSNKDTAMFGSALKHLVRSFYLC